MKKLNLTLKLVVLAVFAGGLGLAGNGLNREVCAMDNSGSGHRKPFRSHRYEPKKINFSSSPCGRYSSNSTRYSKKSFEGLKNAMESFNFSDTYNELQVDFKKIKELEEDIKKLEEAMDKTLECKKLQEDVNKINEVEEVTESAITNKKLEIKNKLETKERLKKPALIRCGDNLEIIERFKTDLDYIKKKCLYNVISEKEELNAIERDLKDKYDAFVKIYKDLSKKDWVPAKNETSEIADNIAKFEREDENNRKIGELTRFLQHLDKLKADANSAISGFKDLANSVPENLNLENLKAFYEKYSEFINNEDSVVKDLKASRNDINSLKKKFDNRIKDIEENELIKEIKSGFSDKIKAFGEKIDELNNTYEMFRKKLEKLYVELDAKKSDEKINYLYDEIRKLDAKKSDEKSEIDKSNKFNSYSPSPRCSYGAEVNLKPITSGFEDLANSVPENPNPENLEAFIKKFSEFIKSKGSVFKNLKAPSNDINFFSEIRGLDEGEEKLSKACRIFFEKMRELREKLCKDTLDDKNKRLYREIEKLEMELSKNTLGEKSYGKILDERNEKVIEILKGLVNDVNSYIERLDSLISFLKDLANIVPEDSKIEDSKAFIGNFEGRLNSNVEFLNNLKDFNFKIDRLNSFFDFQIERIYVNRLSGDQKSEIDKIKEDFFDKIKILEKKKENSSEIFVKFDEKIRKLNMKLCENMSYENPEDPYKDSYKKIMNLYEKLRKNILSEESYGKILDEKRKETFKSLKKFLVDVGSSIECLKPTISFFKDLVDFVPKDMDTKNVEAFVEKYEMYLTDKGSVFGNLKPFCYNLNLLNNFFNCQIEGIDLNKLDAEQKETFSKIKNDFSNKIKTLGEKLGESSNIFQTFQFKINQLTVNLGMTYGMMKLAKKGNVSEIKNLYEKIQNLNKKLYEKMKSCMGIMPDGKGKNES